MFASRHAVPLPRAVTSASRRWFGQNIARKNIVGSGSFFRYGYFAPSLTCVCVFLRLC
jgi:hypothetical protein